MIEIRGEDEPAAGARRAVEQGRLARSKPSDRLATRAADPGHALEPNQSERRQDRTEWLEDWMTHVGRHECPGQPLVIVRL